MGCAKVEFDHAAANGGVPGAGGDGTAIFVHALLPFDTRRPFGRRINPQGYKPAFQLAVKDVAPLSCIIFLHWLDLLH
ncbi:hypothetical protein H6P81_002570 [Aristolochia fimbriata]|uniref:Uncharacterized protein n=1 Tax=Aristolochia fimbriata TaxID=158543 RepID=A0AAV7FA47_ARIFI|nr:hypothetical protein H6P81_002570 [Aristolochia fimbriata]